MSNPWIRREYRARLSTEGAPYVHPDYPEWTFTLRSMDAYNDTWGAAARRVALQPDFADLIKRQAADDYSPTSDERAADSAKRDEMHMRAFVEGCVAGWAGVTNRAGKPVKFSAAEAYKLLEAFPDIANGARIFAATAANFKALTKDEKGEKIAGN